MIDHDRLFKELLSTFFIEFLELFLPEIARQIEPDSISFMPQEYFADLTSGEKKIIDLLAQVKLSGQDAGILIHVEAQSSSKADFTRRIFFYFATLYQKYLQRVYPVVVFSFDEPFREEPHTHTVEIADLKVLEFNFASIQLNRLNWRDYLNQANPVAAALMAKMKIETSDRPKVKAECLRLLATLQLDPARVQFISGFVDTYLQLNVQEETLFQAEVGKLEETDQEGVMQIVTSWMTRGIEQGTEREAKSFVLRLLSKKFGPIPANLQTQLQPLSVTQLENLGESLLDFSTIADLEDWLKTQR